MYQGVKNTPIGTKIRSIFGMGKTAEESNAADDDSSNVDPPKAGGGISGGIGKIASMVGTGAAELLAAAITPIGLAVVASAAALTLAVVALTSTAAQITERFERFDPKIMGEQMKLNVKEFFTNRQKATAWESLMESELKFKSALLDLDKALLPIYKEISDVLSVLMEGLSGLVNIISGTIGVFNSVNAAVAKFQGLDIKLINWVLQKVGLEDVPKPGSDAATKTDIWGRKLDENGKVVWDDTASQTQKSFNKAFMGGDFLDAYKGLQKDTASESIEEVRRDYINRGNDMLAGKPGYNSYTGKAMTADQYNLQNKMFLGLTGDPTLPQQNGKNKAQSLNLGAPGLDMTYASTGRTDALNAFDSPLGYNPKDPKQMSPDAAHAASLASSHNPNTVTHDIHGNVVNNKDNDKLKMPPSPMISVQNSIEQNNKFEIQHEQQVVTAMNMVREKLMQSLDVYANEAQLFIACQDFSMIRGM